MWLIPAVHNLDLNLVASHDSKDMDMVLNAKRSLLPNLDVVDDSTLCTERDRHPACKSASHSKRSREVHRLPVCLHDLI